MQFNDALEVAGTRMTQAGYLVVDARIARTGLQTYSGAELGKPEIPTITVYRPESAVFDEAAMASFAHKPITDDHPPEAVTAQNWKTYSIGHSGGEVMRDGHFIKVPMLVADQASIQSIQAGKREISAGYDADIEFRDGLTPEGEPYQAVITKIRADHIAVVDRGRAGPECRIGDSKPTPPNNRTEIPLKVILIDGLSVEFTPQGAEAVEKLQKQLGDTRSALQAKDGEIAGLRTAHASAIQAKDGEVSAAQAKIADMETRLTPAALDAAVAARSGLLAAARRVLGDSYDASGKTDADIRKAVVAHRLGDKMPAEADPAFVDGAFRFMDLSGDAAPAQDPVRDAVRAHGVRANDSADDYEATFARRAGLTGSAA